MFYTLRPKAQIIDGKKIAETIRNEVKIEVEKMLAEGKRAPYLAAIQVGADPASATYIKNKMKAAASVGRYRFICLGSCVFWCMFDLCLFKQNLDICVFCQGFY